MAYKQKQEYIWSSHLLHKHAPRLKLQAFRFGPCVIYARGIQQYTGLGVELAFSSSLAMGQDDVESFLRDVLMQMLC